MNFGTMNSFSFLGINIAFSNPFIYVLFVSALLFMLGMIYSSIGFFVSLYTNNKILVYSIAVLSLRLYEALIYLLSQVASLLLGCDSSNLYLIFSIFNGLGVYNTFSSISNNLIIFIIVLYLIMQKMKKIENNLINQEDKFYEF